MSLPMQVGGPADRAADRKLQEHRRRKLKETRGARRRDGSERCTSQEKVPGDGDEKEGIVMSTTEHAPTIHTIPPSHLSPARCRTCLARAVA